MRSGVAIPCKGACVHKRVANHLSERRTHLDSEKLAITQRIVAYDPVSARDPDTGGTCRSRIRGDDVIRDRELLNVRVAQIRWDQPDSSILDRAGKRSHVQHVASDGNLR